MAAVDPGSEEYSNLLAHLEKLYALRSGHRSRRIQPDTVLVVAGNLLGILIIVAAEKGTVLSSKALSLLKFK
jgi:hypothetical protein